MDQILDTKQHEQSVWIKEKITQLKDTFVNVLNAKLNEQKDTFAQVLDTKLNEQKEHYDQAITNQSKQFEEATQNLRRSLEENHLMVLNSVFDKDDVEMYSNSSYLKEIARKAMNDDTDDCPTDWVKIM